MGPLNVGFLNHITDFHMETYGTENLYLTQLNDKFFMMLVYGQATQTYLEEFEKVFAAFGIEAHASQ